MNLKITLFTALLLAAPAALHAAEIAKADHDKLTPILAEARSRPVRIFYGGTSIQASSTAGGRRWIENLRRTYGDSGNSSFDLRFQGGSLKPYLGWKKQSGGGLMLRLRGEPTSSDLTFATYGKEIIIHYGVENDGGKFDIEVDDNHAATINSGGSQAYNQKHILTFPAVEYRKLTIKAPATGFAYLETITQRSNRPGIEVLDGSMGATALEHMLNFPKEQEAMSMAPTIKSAELYGAMDSYMLDESATGKFDIVYFGWDVNDSYSVQNVNARYAPAIARLVARTKANKQILILVVEPGGHYSIPSDPGYAANLRIREILRSYATEPHVVVVDHYDLIKTPAPEATLVEWQAWTSLNYLAKLTAIAPKLEATGDFIHPLPQAYDCQVAAMNALSGLPQSPDEARSAERGPEKNVVNEAIADLNRNPWSGNASSTNPGAQPSTRVVRDVTLSSGETHSMRSAGSSLAAIVYPAQSEPLWQSETLANLATAFQAAIAAETTTDAWGKYKAKSLATGITSGAAAVGKPVTITVIVAGGSATIMPRDQANKVTLPLQLDGKVVIKGSVIAGSLPDRPVAVHLTYIPSDSTSYVLILADRIYAVHAVAAAVPVVTSGGKSP